MIAMTTALATKKSRSQHSQKGFTLIEMLAVTVLIGVLVSISVVAYFGASRSTRDSRRKQDLSQLRFALETYRQTYGEYPDTGTGCGTWAYPGCQSTGDWIVGLVPEYIVSLPNDPKQSGEFVKQYACEEETCTFRAQIQAVDSGGTPSSLTRIAEVDIVLVDR